LQADRITESELRKLRDRTCRGAHPPSFWRFPRRGDARWDELAGFAATAGVTDEEFRRQFEYLLGNEPPPLAMDAQGERLKAM
jgi:hypothetical protein